MLALARQGQAIGETRSVSLADVADTAWENVKTPDARLRSSVHDEDGSKHSKMDISNGRVALGDTHGTRLTPLTTSEFLLELLPGT